jgi:integrase
VLPAQLLYGSGLRLLECLRLRVKDVDVSRREIVVPDGKVDVVGVKDGRGMFAGRREGRFK